MIKVFLVTVYEMHLILRTLLHVSQGLAAKFGDRTAGDVSKSARHRVTMSKEEFLTVRESTCDLRQNVAHKKVHPYSHH